MTREHEPAPSTDKRTFDKQPDPALRVKALPSRGFCTGWLKNISVRRKIITKPPCDAQRTSPPERHLLAWPYWGSRDSSSYLPTRGINRNPTAWYCNHRCDHRFRPVVVREMDEKEYSKTSNTLAP